MGDNFFSFSFSIVSLSSLKSSFVPTRMVGALGQWWLTSGYHCKEKGHIITKEYCKKISRFSQVLYKEKWGKNCVDKDKGGLKTVVCSKVCFVLIFLKRTLKTANIDLLFSFLFYMLVALYTCTLCKKIPNNLDLTDI